MTRGWTLLGVVVVAALLGAAQLTGARSSDAPPRPADPRRLTAPVVVGGGDGGARSTYRADPPRRPDEQHPALRPAPEPARRTAADFLRAYLAYEVGRASFDDLRALRQTATARLWSQLNSGRGEPIAPRTVPAARLAHLVPGVSGRRRAVALLATLRRGGDVAPLALVLRREEGRWRVAGLGR
jgi:hypothetical protein